MSGGPCFPEEAQRRHDDDDGGDDDDEGGTVAVLLFDRTSLASMASHALWASAVNEHFDELNVTLARIDLKAGTGKGGGTRATRAYVMQHSSNHVRVFRRSSN